ncbi:DEAD box RNA helicase hela [Exophiala viscosa]|uniref:ATP-dependent RNA helicase n=1 Tax=Exophiala viscosa TaxID=2486360 RepID=A0AAN6DVP4_9EURO|nr:DEAD box RNA helicase hela [Exophiala viscosa]
MARGKNPRSQMGYPHRPKPQPANSTSLDHQQSFVSTHTLPPPTIEVPKDTPRFADLQGKNLLDPTVLHTLTNDLKFDHMMPVQAATLEYLLSGADVLAQAKTGTGKTLAFLLPAIQTILKRNEPRLSALILCPTRELALQIAAEAMKVLQRLPGCKVATSIGGTNKNVEATNILRGCSILVATPGRLLDHLSDERVQSTLSSLRTLVLDEADRMLDMGFLPDIKKILSYLPKTARQSMLFSATIDDQVKNVAHLFLNKGYEFISTIQEGEANTHERVDQYLVLTPNMIEHAPAMVSVVEAECATTKSFKAIVFAPTAAHADFYAEVLASIGTLPKVSVLHSRMTQPKRTRTTQEFRQATNAICVATDVIARGMDFPNVSHVFQVGLPSDKETYVHRLGRTARAGAEGRGILVLGEAEKGFLNQLKGIKIQDYPSSLQYKIEDIEPALADLQTKPRVYQAWLGYYKTFLKVLKWSPADLVREANRFALEGLDCPEVPALEKSTISKMGLKGVPGLVVSANKPGSNNPHRRGGGEGRLQGRAPGRAPGRS